MSVILIKESLLLEKISFISLLTEGTNVMNQLASVVEPRNGYLVIKGNKTRHKTTTFAHSADELRMTDISVTGLRTKRFSATINFRRSFFITSHSKHCANSVSAQFVFPSRPTFKMSTIRNGLRLITIY